MTKPLLLPTPLRRTPDLARSLYLIAFPHGGQRGARRNAWAGMSEDVGRSRARADVDDALTAVAAQSVPILRSGTQG